MNLFSEKTDIIPYKYSAIMLFLLILVLTACDSSDDIPLQQVDTHDRLSDAELLQQHKQQVQHSETFYFGFDLRSSPQEDAAQYKPFLDYLEATTGYTFKLYFTPKNSTTSDELGRNKTQFAAMGATSFLNAQSRYGAISLVRGLNHENKAKYQSVFVVKPNSKIRSIKHFKGHKLAFGSRDSTQGHLIPRIMLKENGISLNDLRAYTYTGSHQNCAEAVVSGKFDICGMQDQLAGKLASQGLLKIVHTSSYYPSSGIVAGKSVPHEVITQVRQALLNFKPQGRHSQGLYNWDRTEMPKGFVATQESDYADLRKWSLHFGFLSKDIEAAP